MPYKPPVENKDTAAAYSEEVKDNSAGISESDIAPLAVKKKSVNTITSKGRRASSTRRKPRKKV